MLKIKHISRLIIAVFFLFTACTGQPPETSSQQSAKNVPAAFVTDQICSSLKLDTLMTWRRDPLANPGLANYNIYMKWSSLKGDNPEYEVEVKVSTRDLSHNRAKIYDGRGPLANLVDENGLKSYSKSTLRINDYVSDFEGEPDEVIANGINQKIYTVTIRYKDTATYGTDSLSFDITRFYDPTQPHTEGDVMRNPRP